MRTLRLWFCRKQRVLLRWSLLLAALTPLAAWSISRAFAVDARSIIVAIAALLFAIWRPYRDSWLRPACGVRTQACASH